jgi:c-di-GMP-binding flagellar brake protein YcgR
MTGISDFLTVNQLVSIELVCSEDELQTMRYASRVENVEEELGENVISLATPIHDMQPVFIPPGTTIKVLFWDGTAIYALPSVVLENKTGSLYQIILLTDVNKLERIQKRQFVRVPLVMDVIVSYLDTKGEKWTILAQSKDISGGGLSLVIYQQQLPFNQDSIIGLQFTLDNTLFKVTGFIARIHPEIDCRGEKVLIVGICYTCISEETRKAIIRSVYSRQIEIRKMGLLE